MNIIGFLEFSNVTKAQEAEDPFFLRDPLPSEQVRLPLSHPLLRRRSVWQYVYAELAENERALAD